MDYVENTPLPSLEQDLRSGARMEEIRTVFGDEMAEELRRMASRRRPAVLGDRPPVVILPGIMGSTLYDMDSGAGSWLWINPVALAQGLLPRIALPADGSLQGAPARIMARDLVPLLYLPLRMHLKFLGGCTVEAFPYDWRRHPADSADDLRLVVQRLFNAEKRKVLLVGHSMGGLVAREYCLKYPAEAERMVERVVMLGTPNYGSFNAVRALTLGDDGALQKIQELNPDNDVVGVVRSLPGVYALLPAPKEAYPSGGKGSYPFNTEFDWYSQQSYGLDAISSRHLKTTRDSYLRLAKSKLNIPVTIVAGINVPTTTGVLRQTLAAGRALFDFSKFVSPEGDGTVPLGSVIGLPGAHVMYVRQGVHALLPWYANVRDAVKRIAHGEDAGLPETIDRGVLDASEGGAAAQAPAIPGDAEAAEVAARVRAGAATPGDLLSLAAMG
jgi:pimeloyl-ACP methyl ester carboxylesterase